MERDFEVTTRDESGKLIAREYVRAESEEQAIDATPATGEGSTYVHVRERA